MEWNKTRYCKSIEAEYRQLKLVVYQCGQKWYYQVHIYGELIFENFAPTEEIAKERAVENAHNLIKDLVYDFSRVTNKVYIFEESKYDYI